MGKGVKTNRRSSFRVSIGVLGWITPSGKGTSQTIIKDVSLTGFAITDRGKELKLEAGQHVAVRFDDLNFNIVLGGSVVRIEEHDDYTIYGFKIHNLCKDLSLYLSTKQRKVDTAHKIRRFH